MTNILYVSRYRSAVRFLAVVLSFALLLPGGAAWAGLQPPLSKIPVPVPRTQDELAQFPELAQFVKNVPAAIQLGKALFWDMQVGSDGKVACATCHFRAGADARLTNTIHPGPDGQFLRDSITGTVFGTGPGQDLTSLVSSIFPFFQIAPTDGRVGFDTIVDPIFGTAPTATITRNIDDVVGSQGVPLLDFVSIVTGTAVETGTTPQTLPIFGTHRQVTDRNSPSVINAVFNHANFWDGRANNIFNGVNPFGPLDQSAMVWVNTGAQERIAIPNASLASQAVGPPMSDVEMAYRGRTFPMLGKKMINNGLIPLGQQPVHPDDSVLGALSCQPNPTTGACSQALVAGAGLNTTYRAMIEAAFEPNLISDQTVTAGFSQIEANFSLFWGLSIMLYEATLVSDRTPFDRFQAGNMNALTLGAQLGLATFDSKCAVCHSGPEFSDAVVGSNVTPNCIAPDCNLVSFTSNTNHRLILLNQTNTLGAKSDTGFFNIAVRPTADDPGRGGAAFTFPLSFSRLAEVPGLPFPTPVNPPFAPTTDAVQGSFKTPGLRNIELNPPYFHNGSALTLIEVVDFYTRGGNFPFNLGNPTGNRELATAVQPLGKLRGGGTERGELVLFLQSLTDERVRQEKAPFDHPELIIPNGDAEIVLSATGGALPDQAVGFLTLNPFISPTTSTLPVIGGAVENQQATVEVIVTAPGRAPAAAPARVIGNVWSFTFTGFPLGESSFDVVATSPTGSTRAFPATQRITLLPTALILGGPQGAVKHTSTTITVGAIDTGGRPVQFYKFKLDNGAYGSDIPVDTPIALSSLSDDVHAVSVIVRDVLGNQQPETSPTTVSWRVKSIPPTVTVEPFPLPTRETSQTVTGTISELGIVPQVTADTGAAVGPATVVSGSGAATWSCQLSGLKKGTNNITVTATDIAQNVATVTTSVTIILPDGCFKGTATPDIGDAVKALRIAVGTDVPSLEDTLHGDVAPLVDGVPVPDGNIDATDALMILKKVAGLVDF